jgi:Flp pilus assembly protein TadB
VRTVLVSVLFALGSVIWILVLITAPIVALVLLLVPLTWDGRRRRRRAVEPLADALPETRAHR